MGKIPLLGGRRGKEFLAIFNLPHVLLARASDGQALGQWGEEGSAPTAGLEGSEWLPAVIQMLRLTQTLLLGERKAWASQSSETWF